MENLFDRLAFHHLLTRLIYQNFRLAIERHSANELSFHVVDDERGKSRTEIAEQRGTFSVR